MLSVTISKIKSVPGSSFDTELTASIDAAEYGYDELSFCAPVTFVGQVENRDGILLVNGQASSDLSYVCDRCGEQYSAPVAVMIDAAYALRGAAPDLDGERDIVEFSGETLDLTQEILKQFFLEQPMKHLCCDDCKGLCPHCGVNLNYDQCSCRDDDIDPRLEILKKFVCDSEKGV